MELAVAGKTTFQSVPEGTAWEDPLAHDALWRDVFCQAPIGMALLDTRGRWQEANDAFCRLVGYTAQELLDRPFSDITALADQAADAECWRQLLTGAINNFQREKRYVRKDGREIWVQVAASAVRDAAGRICQVITQVVDIDALHRAHDSLRKQELLLEAVLGALPVGVRVADASGHLISANMASLELWGDTEAGVRPADDYVASESETGVPLTAADWPLQRALREGNEIEGRLFDIRCFDGSTKTVLCAAMPLLDDAELCCGAIEVAQDMTRWVHLEEQVVAHSRELEARNQELEQFAYVASHDLQEPLRKVSSFVQLFARRHTDKVDATGQQYLDFIVDGAARMQRLIDDLLHYSRVSRGGSEHVPVDLSLVLKGVLSDLALAIEESAASLHIGDLPVVLGDPGQMRALLQNLVGNALKYRDPARPLVVSVSAECQAGVATLRVQDNGIGIDPRYFERIFAIFQRLHSRHEYPGTGIGLAICKRIVENHDGTIRVDSAPDVGSTFECTLKLAGAMDEAG